MKTVFKSSFLSVSLFITALVSQAREVNAAVFVFNPQATLQPAQYAVFEVQPNQLAEVSVSGSGSVDYVAAGNPEIINTFAQLFVDGAINSETLGSAYLPQAKFTTINAGPLSGTAYLLSGLHTASFQFGRVVDNNYIVDGRETHSFTVKEVPEPSTIIGSVMVLGFGTLMKRQYSRKCKKAKQIV